MTQILLIAIVVMIFIVIFQIAKASEYVSVLKGEEKARNEMKFIIAPLLLLAFALACSAEEEADKKLPKATDPIISELNVARTKAATEAIKKLQKVQGELTKKGDLEGAMATKKYIDGLQKSLVFSGQENGAGDLTTLIIGTWDAVIPGWGNTLVIDKDLTFKSKDGYSGKVIIKKERVSLIWNGLSVTSDIVLTSDKNGTIRQSDRSETGTLIKKESP